MATTDVQPWLGPQSYTEQDAQQYKGRNRAVSELLERLGRSRLTVLYSASGMGKRSLLRAGLPPAFLSQNLFGAYVCFDHSETAPSLTEQVVSAVLEGAAKRAFEAPAFHSWESLWQHFHRQDHLFWTADHQPVTPVILLDQFETIFAEGMQTPAAAKRSHAFLTELEDLLSDTMPQAVRAALSASTEDAAAAGYMLEAVPYKFVVAIDEGRLPFLDAYGERLPKAFANRWRLDGFTAAEANAVLTPNGSGAVVDEEAKKRIIAACASSSISPTTPGETVHPALLSILCFHLNNERVKRKKETIDETLVAENANGILRRFYENAFVGISKSARVFVEEKLISSDGHPLSAEPGELRKVRGVSQNHVDALVERRILRLVKNGKAESALRLAHGVLGDTVKRSRDERHLSEARAARIRAVLIKALLRIAAVAVIVIPLTWLAVHYLYVWEYASHFAAVTSQRGVPLGVGALSDEQLKKRSTSFKIVRIGRIGPVDRMVAVNGQGRVTPHHAYHAPFGEKIRGEGSLRRAAVRWTYTYDAAGELQAERAFDRKDRLVWSLLYDSNTSQKKNSTKGDRIALFVGEEDAPLSRFAGRLSFQYDPLTGDKISVQYYDAAKKPVLGPRGVYGKRYTYDSDSRVLTESAVDEEGNPTHSTSAGITVTRHYHEDLELPVSVAFVDNSGKPVSAKEGFALKKIKYDEAGNPTEISFWGFDAKKAAAQMGYHRVMYGYDQRGNQILETFFTAKGLPTHDRKGCFGYSKIHDDAGNVESESCIDVNRQAVINSNGYATVRRKFDQWGDRVETAYFDAKGEPTVSGGYHRVAYRLDNLGREIQRRYTLSNGKAGLVNGYARAESVYSFEGRVRRTAYFDVNDKPAILPKGYHQEVVHYDKAGRPVEVRYLGPDKEPVLIEGDFAGYRIRYDRLGYENERVFLGVDDAVVMTEYGYASIQSTHNPAGNLIKQAYYDSSGQPTSDKQAGVAGFVASYDANHNEIERRYFDTSGKPTGHADGYVGLKKGYNESGDLVRVERIDEKGTLAYGKDGVCGYENLRDAAGRVTRKRYFGPDGKGVTHRDGFAETRLTYDRLGAVLTVRYLDVRGGSTNYKGCAEQRNKTDTRGRITQTDCFDSYGNPTRTEEEWSRVVNKYDSFGNQIESAYFDRHGAPVHIKGDYHRAVKSFDALGNVLKEQYFSRDNTLMNNDQGIAAFEYQYQGSGMIGRAAFNAAGEPARFSEGFHKEVIQRDSIGRVVSNSYFDERGEPLALEGRYHKVVHQYDSKTREKSVAYYGLDGRPVDRRDSYFRCVSRYDDEGRIVEKIYYGARGDYATILNGYTRFGVDYQKDPNSGQTLETQIYYGLSGRRTMGSDGKVLFARRVRELDGYNRVRSVAYYGPSDILAAQSDGCAMWKYGYDAWGNQAVAACYRNEEQPIKARGNYHRYETTYNSRGQAVEEATFDTSDRLIVNSSGFARIKRGFDDRGNLVSVEVFNAQEKPSSAAFGYAAAKYVYDDVSNIVEEIYLGENGKPVEVKGISHVKRTFDKSGNQISLVNLNRRGEVVDEEQYGYDQKGNKISEKRFAAGKPVKYTGRPYHELRYDYDEWGRLTRQYYLDLNGLPIRGVSPKNQICGQYLVTYEQDGTKKEICESRLPEL